VTSWPLVLVEDGLALAHHVGVERRIADGLARRIAAPHELERAQDLVASLRTEPLASPRGPVALTAEQEAAVAAVLSERTVVLTGGPGTGKTSIVVAMLRALARRDGPERVREVALAAPTGKAADRLGESVRSALGASPHPADATLAGSVRPPSTLHRLLGYRPRDGSFRAHRGNRLAERVVIVDEASMIDASLFAQLLDAVAPDATLVLLGDPDQLPSVDPGAVLRDLVRADPPSVRVVSLTQSHRMDPRDPDGAHVLSAARACLVDGPRAVEAFRRVDATTPTPRGGGAWWVEPEQVSATLEAWIARHVLQDDLLASLRSVPPVAAGEVPPAVAHALERASRARLLTVLRHTAEELDAHAADAVARWHATSTHGAATRRDRGRGAILPGEPVMVVQNDYDEDLWNGDSGIAWCADTGEMRVSFRRGRGAITRPLAAVAHLVERAHAVTVHKAQGSEHDEVMLVLPPLDGPLLSREIVYTAVTRARRSAIVAGPRALFEAALARRGERDTLLPALLSHAAVG
jgi:exodeoxyribonuclease V alpha subunit